MRGAGVAIEALVKYVSLFQKGDSTRETRKDILREQRELLIARIAEMQEALDKLNFKIENYDTLIWDVEKENKRLGGLTNKRSVKRIA
jgi:DNA-binding transcriptional MerR regulator